jgi:hypothetical protein
MHSCIDGCMHAFVFRWMCMYTHVISPCVDAFRRRQPGGPLYGVRWRRVVLDEAHVAKDAAGLAAGAARSLHAARRWALTGTPVQNRLEVRGPARTGACARAVTLARFKATISVSFCVSLPRIPPSLLHDSRT